MEREGTYSSSFEEREDIKAGKELNFQLCSLILLVVLILIYIFSMVIFHLIAILKFDLIALSIFGMAMGTYGLLKAYRYAIYLSIFILGILVVTYAINDGEIVYIILLTTLLVAYYYAQYFLSYTSNILQTVKGGETYAMVKMVIQSSALKIVFITISTFMLSFILLNLSFFSTLGFTGVWSILVLVIVFFILTALLIAIPRKEAA